jgi:hypothetical protein
MGKVKTIVVSVVSGIAVALALVTFYVLRFFLHGWERANAEDFMQNAPSHHRETVLEDLGAKRETYEQTVDALTHEVEQQTKEEIVEGFKRAFGVRPNVHPDADSHGRSDDR